MTADVRQMLALAAAIDRAAATAERRVKPVVVKGAMNIKRDWRAHARTAAGRHARRYPSSITFDVAPVPGGVRAVVGPDKALPQGPLGNLLEFGSANNPPQMSGARALITEAPKFLAAMDGVAASAQRMVARFR
jgi:hypothetical protein